MRNILICVVALCLNTTSLFATRYQIAYSYDLNGNRLHRTVAIFSKSSKMSGDDSQSDVKFYETLQNGISYRIYPNPTKGILKFEVSPFDDDMNNATVVVLNSNGQIVSKSQKFKGEQYFDLTNNPDGMYFIRLTMDQKEMTWKVVKQ